MSQSGFLQARFSCHMAVGTSTFLVSQGGWDNHVFRVTGRLVQARFSCHRAVGTVQPRFSCHRAVGTTTLFRSQGGLVRRRCSGHREVWYNHVVQVTGRFGTTTLFRSQGGLVQPRCSGHRPVGTTRTIGNLRLHILKCIRRTVKRKD